MTNQMIELHPKILRMAQRIEHCGRRQQFLNIVQYDRRAAVRYYRFICDNSIRNTVLQQVWQEIMEVLPIDINDAIPLSVVRDRLFEGNPFYSYSSLYSQIDYLSKTGQIGKRRKPNSTSNFGGCMYLYWKC